MVLARHLNQEAMAYNAEITGLEACLELVESHIDTAKVRFETDQKGNPIKIEIKMAIVEQRHDDSEEDGD
jgi:hypothetical protein